MRYWCLVTRPNNWEVCKAERVFGFEFGYAKTLEKFMGRGDKAIVYLTELTGFGAAVEITSKGRFDPARAKSLGWDRFYPYLIDIALEREGFIPIASTVSQGNDGAAIQRATENTFLNDIEFITDSGAGPKGNPRWNLFLYPSLMRIPESDYRTVMTRL